VAESDRRLAQEDASAKRVHAAMLGWAIRSSLNQVGARLAPLQGALRGWMVRSSMRFFEERIPESDWLLGREDHGARRIQAAVAGWVIRSSLCQIKQKLAPIGAALSGWAVRSYVAHAKTANLKLAEEDESACRIQGAVAGFLTRRWLTRLQQQRHLVERKPYNSKYEMHAAEADLNLVEEDQAASRIQAAMGGWWARTSLKLYKRCREQGLFAGPKPIHGCSYKELVAESSANLVEEDEGARRLQAALAGWNVRSSLKTLSGWAERSDANLLEEDCSAQTIQGAAAGWAVRSSLKFVGGRVAESDRRLAQEDASAKRVQAAVKGCVVRSSMSLFQDITSRTVPGWKIKACGQVIGWDALFTSY